MFSYIWSDNSTQESIEGYDSSYKINTVIPVLWLEHCVECAMPLCYRTCHMFIDRGDGRCRRFQNGTQLYHTEKGPLRGATIEFRKWGKLEAAIRTKKFVTVKTINRSEKAFNLMARIVDKPCSLLKWKWHRPSRLIENFLDEHWIPKCIKSLKNGEINGLLMTVYNHSKEQVRLHVELMDCSRPIFHSSLLLTPGWNEELIDCSLPHEHNQLSTRIYLENEDNVKLTFQTLEFASVFSKLVRKKPARKVKCVAWDLDNTMWRGIIGDDGIDGVAPMQESMKLVKALDEMGVIQTIVSKNEEQIALEKLKQLGIEEYFLYPAINWGRKSQSLIKIAKELNINIDTFAVIDDSEFERNEISMTLPQVRVYDIKEVSNLLNFPEFCIPITNESKNRRQSYMVESKRKKILASWSGDYGDFLRDCEIQLEIFKPIEPEEQKRCLELIQRSNQYNITRDRRQESYIQLVNDNPNKRSYAFRVSDKFGNYGIVGYSAFEIIDGDWYMRDYVMSCRVAQKTIERAFCSYIIANVPDNHSLYLNIEKTERNAPIRTELLKLPFEKVADDDKVLGLKYQKFNKAEKFDSGVINVIS